MTSLEQEYALTERRDATDTKKDKDIRWEEERDVARIIHSAAFRRLQSKTQVLGLGESDFYRTRLTHSMEVSQIGVGILKFLDRSKDLDFPEDFSKQYLPTSSQISAICLAHDIGHPPFGHGGEVALNYCMQGAGGFEGNGQTLRNLGHLAKYRVGYGINPTRRTILGVLKYPISFSQTNYGQGQTLLDPSTDWLFSTSDSKPPKCYLDCDQETFDFATATLSKSDRDLYQKTEQKTIKRGNEGIKINKSIYQSLDTSIMSLADDISYGIHDLEDAISLKMIDKKKWYKAIDVGDQQSEFDRIFRENLDCSFVELTGNLFEEHETQKRKRAIGELVHLMISNVCIEVQNSEFECPLLKFTANLSADAQRVLDALKQLVVDEVILHASVQQLEFKGQKIIFELFQVMRSDPKRFLPDTKREAWLRAETIEEGMRVICDYIAGMTDEYAVRLYEKILVSNKGSIFDRI